MMSCLGHPVRCCVVASMLLAMNAPIAVAQQSSGPRYGPMMHDGWYGWFVGPIMMMVFLVITVVVVVSIVRWLLGPHHGHAPISTRPNEKSPLDILKERFARGEIDKDEYEERRKILHE